ncbi:MAG: hypothetical protein NWS20_05035 [Rickettsiaceae bacterium]|nr:hypothetical protein [Rickettsiaceae bacterium]MDP4832973.1 hypothetical protein [Rickettsiaceae bacterium]MDP5020514.1 hypothetical protein [Rickettsiaceae bacterium]MDP5083644.1 hypothetical protein [Rickettsiaceae bacterium]
MILKNCAAVEFSRIMQTRYNTNDLNGVSKNFITNPEFAKSTIEDILGLLKNTDELRLLCSEEFSVDALEFLKQFYIDMSIYLQDH